MTSGARKIVDFSANSPLAGNDEAQGVGFSDSTWKAFRAGMQILQRYANHAPVDMHAVAKSNLQLLHRSLSKDCKYLEIIENIQRKRAISTLPTLQRLYADKELIADFLTVQSGASISLAAFPHRYTMYLLVSGNAHLSTSNEISHSERHWWNRVGTAGSKKWFRCGAVFIPSSEQHQNRLTAVSNNCVILKVHTPMIETPCRIAS